MFSRRVPADLRPNRISQTRSGCRVDCDLTASNPTSCGIGYPPELLAPLAAPGGFRYDPHPRGQRVAREAVAAELGRLGAAVNPERIVLTASTSEAYAFLFKLLCEPGDAVLAPTPSYPLFEHLGGVEAVAALPYRLSEEFEWRLDPGELAQAPDGVRAAVVVHPNNPTGSFVHPEDADALVAVASRRGWAVIADEVFLDYPLDGGPGDTISFAARDDALVFTLGGLSKCVGLPQLKLAWIAVSGPPWLADEALDRLDFIADTFLSVATPVQLALPSLLRQGAVVREAIRERCRSNLAGLRRLAGTLPAVAVLPAGGGWSAVVRIPAVVDEEELTIELLREDGIAVHPGFFFDFPGEGYLVVSLLPEPEVFGEGIARLLRRLSRHLG